MSFDFSSSIIFLDASITLVPDREIWLKPILEKGENIQIVVGAEDLKSLVNVKLLMDDSSLLIQSPSSMALLVRRHLETAKVSIIAAHPNAFSFLLQSWGANDVQGLNHLSLYVVQNSEVIPWIPKDQPFPIEGQINPLPIQRHGTLLLSFIVDNSLALDANLYQDFQANLKQFCSRLAAQINPSIVDFSVLSFGPKEPFIVKDFGSLEFHDSGLLQGGLPFLQPLVEKSLAMIDDQEKKWQQKEPNHLYKSWMVVFTNQVLFDDSDTLLASLVKVFDNSQKVLLPFVLRPTAIPGVFDRIKTLKLNRKPNVHLLKQYQFERMFNFLYEFALRRVQTPLEETIKLLQKDLEGWVV